MSKFCLFIGTLYSAWPGKSTMQEKERQSRLDMNSAMQYGTKTKVLSLLTILVLLITMLMMPTTVWDSKAVEDGSRSRKSSCHLMMIMVMVVKVMMMMLTRTVWESKAGAGGPGEQVPPRLSNRHHPRLARAPLKVPSLIFQLILFLCLQYGLSCNPEV